MFRPAGFSDSDSEEGFSSNRRCYSSDEDQKTWTRGRPFIQSTTIPWETVNNNNQREAEAAPMASDATVSDPALGPVLEKTKKYLHTIYIIVAQGWCGDVRTE